VYFNYIPATALQSSTSFYPPVCYKFAGFPRTAETGLGWVFSECDLDRKILFGLKHRPFSLIIVLCYYIISFQRTEYEGRPFSLVYHLFLSLFPEYLTTLSRTPITQRRIIE